MRAVVVSDGAPEGDFSKVTVVNDHPVPTPGDGQMLIKVAASSINPVDWKIMENSAIWPAVPGFDVAGVVETMDHEHEDCGRFQQGDGVWTDLGKGLGNGHMELGAWAEYAVADCSQVGQKPKSMSFEDAASLPLVALTDLQALRMVGAPWQDWRTHRENLTVVVTSGSGGTGVIAIQLAKAYGAKHIITSASPRNADLLRSLGATLVVDYHESTIWEKLADDTVDVIYDNFGAPGTADAAMSSLKANGEFIFLPGKGGAISQNPKPGVHQLDFGLCDSSKYEDLDLLKSLAEAGMLLAVVPERHTLENIQDVLESSHAGHAVGKIGINITSLADFIV
jgi:NADPH:quinone reductase-like Zn-dependent oxidoreductase